ncbi:alpha carbonic anhydrase 7-like [Arachis duranensis]|uniref:Alpha carbonic anhydrase 7-like n=1 Tax=Arachis duranensis TaxID=130453 RepID=A0A6P4CK37_ARADU|nr:alpha carbonic anhydrase 7-like [Arachis duranensis]
MEKFSSKFFICILFAALLLLYSPARSQELFEDEDEYNYDENSDRGPSHWGNIKPEWRTCKTGRMQSPIDLNKKRLQLAKLGPLNLNYNPSNATLKKNIYEIELLFLDPTSSLTINGTRYILQNLHWHIPSEHTINGRRLDLEVHLVHVHQTPTTNLTAVIGILFKIGSRTDPLLLEEDLKALSGLSVGANRSVGVFDPSVINIERDLYYRYMGSLTTPPCTENVTWTILKQVRKVRGDQIKLLQNAVADDSNGNARPIQPTNNRKVQLNKEYN